MNAQEILKKVHEGMIAYIPTHTRCTKIDRKCVERFEKANAWLLKDEGDGYRLRAGKSSVYLFPGQIILRER